MYVYYVCIYIYDYVSLYSLEIDRNCFFWEHEWKHHVFMIGSNQPTHRIPFGIFGEHIIAYKSYAFNSYFPI